MYMKIFVGISISLLAILFYFAAGIGWEYGLIIFGIPAMFFLLILFFYFLYRKSENAIYKKIFILIISLLSLPFIYFIIIYGLMFFN
jgi:hypothetical protein